MFYNTPINIYRWYRRIYFKEEVLEAGFKYIPKPRILTSLRRAEQDAVRKLLDRRETDGSREATAMIDSLNGKIDKIGRDNNTKFEALNQRFDQLLRRVDTIGSNGADIDVSAVNLSWASALDKVWHAPPAFTKADVGKTVTFSPLTWPLMHHLQQSEKELRGTAGEGGEELGYPSVEWDEQYAHGCHVALSLVTLSKPGTSTAEDEQRLVSWQGVWSVDGRGGTFAKVLDPSGDEGDGSVITTAASVPASLVISSVDGDAVMKRVALTPVGASSTLVVENPERFPYQDAMLKLMPTEVAAKSASGGKNTPADQDWSLRPSVRTGQVGLRSPSVQADGAPAANATSPEVGISDRLMTSAREFFGGAGPPVVPEAKGSKLLSAPEEGEMDA